MTLRFSRWETCGAKRKGRRPGQQGRGLVGTKRIATCLPIGVGKVSVVQGREPGGIRIDRGALGMADKLLRGDTVGVGGRRLSQAQEQTIWTKDIILSLNCILYF